MAFTSLTKPCMLSRFTRGFTTATKLVSVDVNDKSGVATVTLQRPPVNSLNLELLTDINNALTELGNNRSRGVIITSAYKTFSAGLDIMEMYKPNPERVKKFWIALQDTYVTLYGSFFPTVAVINGPAPAGGCLLSMCCEYRIMLSNVFIGLNETRLGIVAPKWFAQTMVNTIGVRQTELALTRGHLFTTEEALKVGLVDEVVRSKEEGLEKAQYFLNNFAKISPMARGMSKNMVREESLKKMIKDRENDLNIFLAAIRDEQTQKGLGMYIETLKKKDSV